MNNSLLSSLHTDISFPEEPESKETVTLEILKPVIIIPQKYSDWTREITDKFSQVRRVEIHLPRMVCSGTVFSEFVFISENLKFMMEVRGLEVAHESVKLTADTEVPDFVLEDAGKPKFINEDGWDLFWFGFKNGYAAFYFNKP